MAIPKIDFTQLEPGNNKSLAEVEAKVIDALESFGCFELLYDKVTPELREALFGRAALELFSLPMDVKKRNQYNSKLPFQGFVGDIPTMAYESLRIKEGDAEGFTRLMWPQGNSSFCDTITTCTKHLKELEQMIVSMVFHGLGVETYCKSHFESTVYGLRFSQYGVLSDQESKVALPPHYDPNFVTIICQHKVEGLEVQTREGEWIHVRPLPNSFIDMIGQAFEALSNGRLKAPLHGVGRIGDETKYSVIFAAVPKDECIIQASKELVDKEHPMMYKPCAYSDHLLFRSQKAGGAQLTLKDYCGIGGEKVEAN